MNRFKDVSDEDSDRVNGIQADYFTKARKYFDPPYPDGVPERLGLIVASAGIRESDTVVDIGTGTGVLIPLIKQYKPESIYACDLSEGMLQAVKERYPDVHTHLGGIAQLLLPDNSVDVCFINACYPNLSDKHRIFLNIARMMKPGGRIVISHPMGRKFTEFLKREMPFPVDDFPDSVEKALDIFEFYNFRVTNFVDDEFLYILLLESNS